MAKTAAAHKGKKTQPGKKKTPVKKARPAKNGAVGKKRQLTIKECLPFYVHK